MDGAVVLQELQLLIGSHYFTYIQFEKQIQLDC
jgi:hypothetical protein